MPSMTSTGCALYLTRPAVFSKAEYGSMNGCTADLTAAMSSPLHAPLALDRSSDHLCCHNSPDSVRYAEGSNAGGRCGLVESTRASHPVTQHRAAAVIGTSVAH
jgi:hypothetical protein